MDENKCCENYASSYAKDMDSFCVREFLHDLAVCDKASERHVRIINGWTEITPDNENELTDELLNRIIIGFKDCEGRIHTMTLLDCYMGVGTMAKHGGYYFYVLPELRIE